MCIYTVTRYSCGIHIKSTSPKVPCKLKTCKGVYPEYKHGTDVCKRCKKSNEKRCD